MFEFIWRLTLFTLSVAWILYVVVIFGDPAFDATFKKLKQMCGQASAVFISISLCCLIFSGMIGVVFQLVGWLLIPFGR